jgi:thiol-disulfide isomerase/thioredoxin
VGVAIIAVVALVAVLLLATSGGNSKVAKETNKVALENQAGNAGNTVNAGNTNTGSNQNINQVKVDTTPKPSGISTFEAKAGAEICKENGKPVVYLFSTTTCPHCQWIKSTFDSLMKEYVAAGKIVAYHWELDTNDNTLTSAVETQVPENQYKVYQTFNPEGYVPTFVFGCKYFRVGNGYERAGNLEAEKAEFRAVIDDLLK